jgi:hypothetical protein
MRRTEISNELRDFSLVLIIISPVGTEKMGEGPKLLALTALGYIFHSIAKWFGVFAMVNS